MAWNFQPHHHVSGLRHFECDHFVVLEYYAKCKLSLIRLRLSTIRVTTVAYKTNGMPSCHH